MPITPINRSIQMIVIRDEHLGLIQRKEKSRYGSMTSKAVKLPPFIKYAKLGEALGAWIPEFNDGIVTNVRELEDALLQALEKNNQPSVIEVKMAPSYDKLKFLSIRDRKKHKGLSL